MGSRISQSEPLWWVDQGDNLKNLAATALCIRQCSLFLPALPLRAQIPTTTALLPSTPRGFRQYDLAAL